MLRTTDELFARHTTLELGGPAREWWRLESTDEIVQAVAEADAAGVPVLVVGGGSNLVASDAGFDGRVLQIANRDFAVRGEEVTVAAGESWDAVVARCVDAGLAGVECLSGIPGTAGATPMQNVGAYGQEVADTITRVEAYDRREKRLVALTPAQCAFAYRDSALKGSDRWVVTGITMALHARRTAAKPTYPELVRALGGGVDVPRGDVRAAVIGLRRAKGMVVDPLDPESTSAGSFFMNPVLDAAQLEEAAKRLGEAPPRYPHADRFKVPAAWLIERCGFAKGYGGPHVAISHKHALALVHYGGGTTTELVALARTIRDGVQARSGVTLKPEPIFVGVNL
jgi:UDP-N-acetylmuramate dehydrogenase